MAKYLIDYENVFESGLNGIDKLIEEDGIYIFFSKNSDYITFGMSKKLNETKAYNENIYVDVGTKNALDFQLATYLGYLICQDQGSEKKAIL